MARYLGHVRVTVSSFGSTRLVVGLAFDMVDCAFEKTRWALTKLRQDLVSPLVNPTSIMF